MNQKSSRMPHVLIAEDDAPLRRVLGAVLAADGHDVALAEDGRDAWEQYQHRPADLVITDLYMPKMGGVELLLRVLDKDPEARVIAMTALGLSERNPILNDAKILGAVAVLEKPFDESTLLESISFALADQEETEEGACDD